MWFPCLTLRQIFCNYGKLCLSCITSVNRYISCFDTYSYLNAAHELQPNFHMHYKSVRNVCTLPLLQSWLCNVSVKINHLCSVFCTWLPTCLLHNGCIELFLLHVLHPRTPALTYLLILCHPPHCCRQLPGKDYFCLCALDSQDYKDFLTFILSIIPSLWLLFFSPISSEPYFVFVFFFTGDDHRQGEWSACPALLDIRHH